MAATITTISIGNVSEAGDGAPLSNDGAPKTLAHVQYKNHSSTKPNPSR